MNSTQRNKIENDLLEICNDINAISARLAQFRLGLALPCYELDPYLLRIADMLGEAESRLCAYDNVYRDVLDKGKKEEFDVEAEYTTEFNGNRCCNGNVFLHSFVDAIKSCGRDDIYDAIVAYGRRKESNYRRSKAFRSVES